ncbi:MAG: SixA phosphatase family protein [Pseudomonadota bacterium]
MKRLGLWRHAKSSWDDPSLGDIDRPLNDRGKRDAPRMALAMEEMGLHWDLVLCSPARRAWQSGAALVPAGACVELVPALYLASATTLVALIHALPDGKQSVLIIGHNPGLHDLAQRLTQNDSGAARKALAMKFPTAALAVIACKTAHWSDIAPGHCQLSHFVRPHDLKG